MSFKFIRHLDLFPSPIKLFYDGRSTRSSFLGLTLSFGIYSLMTYLFFMSDLFSHQNPIVVSQELQLSHANRIVFTEKMIFSFGVFDVLGARHMDPSIFSVKFKYFKNISSYELKELRPCKIADFPPEFMGTNVSNSFCLKDKNFTLEGSLDDGNIQYVSISLFSCNNLTSSVICKSQEKIDEFFNDIYITKFFGTQYHNSKINLYDYQNPIAVSSRIDIQMLDTKIKKRLNIFLKNSDVETGDGTIFKSQRIQTDILFDTLETDFQMRVSTSQPLFQILLFASKNRVKSTRRYVTLPEVLGSIFGVAQFFNFVCLVWTNWVIYISTLKKVLNKLYVFPTIPKKKKKSKKDKNNEKKSKIPAVKNNNKESENKSSKMSQSKPTFIPVKYQIGENQVVGNKKFNSAITLSRLENDLKKQNLNMQDLANPNSLFFISPKFLKDDSLVLEHYSEIPENFDLELKKNVQSNDFQNKKPRKEIILEPKEKEARNVKDSCLEPSSLQIKIDTSLTKSKFKNKNYQKVYSFLKRNSMEEKNSKSKKNELKLNYRDYIFYLLRSFFCIKLKPIHQLISLAEKTYKQDMDIINIVSKLHDLEKLKVLLLDENQLVLFNYLSKPIISPQDKKNCSFENLSPSNQRMTDLIRKKNPEYLLEETYKCVAAQTEVNSINKRLIELIDERICGNLKTF